LKSLILFYFLLSNLRIDLFANFNQKKDDRFLNIHLNVKEYNENLKKFLINEGQVDKENDNENKNKQIISKMKKDTCNKIALDNDNDNDNNNDNDININIDNDCHKEDDKYLINGNRIAHDNKISNFIEIEENKKNDIDAENNYDNNYKKNLNLEIKSSFKKNNLNNLNNFLINLIQVHTNLNDDLDIFIEKLEQKYID
jgi:hypothetical protein